MTIKIQLQIEQRSHQLYITKKKPLRGAARYIILSLTRNGVRSLLVFNQSRKTSIVQCVESQFLASIKVKLM